LGFESIRLSCGLYYLKNVCHRERDLNLRALDEGS
jgi:hypothetical protein